MYKEGSVYRVLEDYKITITGSTRQYENTLAHINKSFDDVSHHFDVKTVEVFSIEIPEHKFKKMADMLCEFDDLMRDPETARLLMEARFINRLKGNR